MIGTGASLEGRTQKAYPNSGAAQLTRSKGAIRGAQPCRQ